MKCREAQRILTEEIHLAESAEVRRHLEGCQTCRNLQRDLLSLQQLSGELKGRTKVPPFFAERVCSRASGRSRAPYWSVAVIAAGVVFLAIGVANLSGLWTESEGKARPRALNGGERVQRIEPDNGLIETAQESQPDVFHLGGDESGSQETDHVGSQTKAPRVMTKTAPSEYVLELPATIEVRQTQADNEFYLENVSH